MTESLIDSFSLGSSPFPLNPNSCTKDGLSLCPITCQAAPWYDRRVWVVVDKAHCEESVSCLSFLFRTSLFF